MSKGSSVPVVSRWLGPGNRTFLEVASIVVAWWIVAFLHSVTVQFIVPGKHLITVVPTLIVQSAVKAHKSVACQNPLV